MKATIHARNRYIACYEDFQALAQGRLAGAMALRVGEVKTDELIEYYRGLWPDMPEDALPDEEYLWFDADYRTFSEWTLRIRCRTMLVEMLCNGRKHTGLLISRGYLRSRWVYYEDPEHRSETKNVAVRTTRTGKAYVVTDERGMYQVEGEEEPRSAVKDGFVYRRRQWLYCIDAINAAIAKLNGEEAVVEPVKRWRPEANDGDARTKQRLTTTTTPGSPPPNTPMPAAQGGSKNAKGRAVPDEVQSSITGSAMQYLSAETLTAPLTAETLIVLARAIPGLTVPRREDCDELTWHRDVQRPTELLLRLPKVMQWLASGDDARAWQYLEGTLRYMVTPDSPSWWQTQRARNTPITLRHVAKEFTTQLRDMETKMALHQWSPSDCLAYIGPKLEMPPMPLSGMTEQEALRLADEILAAYPGLLLALGDIPGRPGRVGVGIEYAPKQYLDIYASDEWHRRGAEIEEKVRLGLAFAEALAELGNGEENQDSQGPPGNN